MKYVGISIVIITIFLVLMSSCAPATVSNEPIKIGLFLDFSGVGGADIGPYHKEGVDLKLEEVGYQFNGRPIETIIADTAGDPTVGTDKAKKLVQIDKVDVVIGEVWAHVSFAAAPIFAEAKIPQLLPVGEPIEIMDLSAGNLYLPHGSHCAQSYYAGVYAATELGYKTAVIIHDDFSTGENEAKGFVGGFEENGGTVVQTIKSPLPTFDFAPYISTIKDADVVAMWIIPTELPVFYKQYYEFGLDMPIMYTYLQAWDEIWQTVGDDCLGTTGQASYSTALDNKQNKEFLEAFAKKYDKPATMFHENGYAFTTMYLEALKSTGGDTSPDKINAALKSMSFNLPEGKLSFTPEGIGIGDELILKVIKNNNIYDTEILKTYSQVIRKAPWQ